MRCKVVFSTSESGPLHVSFNLCSAPFPSPQLEVVDVYGGIVDIAELDGVPEDSYSDACTSNTFGAIAIGGGVQGLGIRISRSNIDIRKAKGIGWRILDDEAFVLQRNGSRICWDSIPELIDGHAVTGFASSEIDAIGISANSRI